MQNVTVEECQFWILMPVHLDLGWGGRAFLSGFAENCGFASVCCSVKLKIYMHMWEFCGKNQSWVWCMAAIRNPVMAYTPPCCDTKPFRLSFPQCIRLLTCWLSCLFLTDWHICLFTFLAIVNKLLPPHKVNFRPVLDCGTKTNL